MQSLKNIIIFTNILSIVELEDEMLEEESINNGSFISLPLPKEHLHIKVWKPYLFFCMIKLNCFHVLCLYRKNMHPVFSYNNAFFWGPASTNAVIFSYKLGSRIQFQCLELGCTENWNTYRLEDDK